MGESSNIALTLKLKNELFLVKTENFDKWKIALMTFQVRLFLFDKVATDS